MVHSCCVMGCNARSHNHKKQKLGNDIRFFRFPAWKRGFGQKMGELTKRRRMAWVAAVGRKGITFETASPHMRVCSQHFHKGQPAYEMMETDPDWAPSLQLGHTSVKPTDTSRAARRIARAQLQKKMLEQKMVVNPDAAIRKPQTQDCKSEPGEDSSHQQNDEAPHTDEGEDALSEEGAHEAGKESEQQITADETRNPSQDSTQPECDLCVLRRAEINRLMEENRQLRRQLKMDDNFFGEDEDKVKYYTGLPNLRTFMALFNFLLPLMPTQKRVLTPFQMLLVTFMRLRLDLPPQHLAHLFNVSPKTVYRTFNEMVSFLYVNLRRSIVWPDRETLYRIMPQQFVEAFGRKVAIIIDCFEILTEKPSNLKERAQTFSSYKQPHTMKYLMGITPRGAISFLSKGWEGHTSDQHITLNSGFLEHLLPGDIVLADRGFDIQEHRGMFCAEVKLPAFTKGRCQLAAQDVEETRKVAHLRIHVKKANGNVCQKYPILTGTIPIQMLYPCKGEDVTMLDKVVTVCCALTNHSPTIC